MADLEMLPDVQENTPGVATGEQPWIFHSPNVETRLTPEQAYPRMFSSNQHAARRIAADVFKAAGVGDVKTHDALGAWFEQTPQGPKHYAENSFAHVLEGSHSPEDMRYLAAWLGLLHNQHRVIYFNGDVNGKDALYQVYVPNLSVRELVPSLQRNGLTDHTLIPKGRGHLVVIYSEGGADSSKVEGFAREHNASIREARGTGNYIGGDGSSRSTARAAYREAIQEYEKGIAEGSNKPLRRNPAIRTSPQSLFQMKRRGIVVRLRRIGSRVYYDAGTRAPVGGVVVRGMMYKGGEFIPSAMLAKASPQERAKISQGSESDTSSRSLASRILASVKSAPARLVAQAKGKALETYNQYVSKYGKKWTAAIIGAGLVGLPIPVPGASPVAMAAVAGIAELYLRLKGGPTRKQLEEHTLNSSEVRRLGLMFIQDYLTALGMKLRDLR